MSNYSMRSPRLCLLCAAGLLPALLLATLCLAQEQKPPSIERAPQTFKNLKVLKGMSVDDVYTEMRSYDKALHVGCGYCHFGGFDKDVLPQKLQARQMLLMTRKLNKHYPTLKGKVTCWTCHAGKKQPVTALP